MKKRGIILLLGIFVISSLIVVFNNYNVSNPMISEDNPDVTDSKTYDAETFPEASNDILSSFFINEGFYSGLVLDPDGHSWYNISLNFDESIIINLYFSNSSPGGDLNLELWNFTDVLDVSYSNTDNESITYLIKNPGYYYIHVFNQSDFYDSYDLEIEIDDRFEPNNDLSNAEEINPNWYSSLKCKDDDWFMFWMNTGEEFTVDLYFINASGNLDLELWDNTIMLKNSTSNDDNEFITWIAGYTGYHYIHIYSLGADNVYDLDFYKSGLIEDTYEENDDFFNPSDIFLGYFSPLSCKDEDWFRFQINYGEEFSVNIYFTNSTGDLYLELRDDSNTLLTWSYSPTDNEYITWNATYTGDYYVRIFSLTNDNTYALDIFFSGPSEDPYEDNDIIDDAFPLDPHHYSGLYCQDDDWFKFHAQPGDQIMLEIYFNNDSGNLDVQFYSESYTLLTWSYSNDNDEYITWSASYPGYYYIRIFNLGQANYYDLNIKITHDKYEPNNYFLEAAELFRGSHYNLLCKDNDWFKCKVNSGEQFIVEIYFEHSNGDLNLEVKNNLTGPVAGSYSTTDDELITFTITYTGFYYIRVYNETIEENWYVIVLGGQPDLIFQEDFEGPISSKWSGFGGGNYWHVTTRDNSPSSPTHSLWCGNELTGWYDKGYYYTDSIVIEGLDLRDYCFAGLYFDFKYTTGPNKHEEIGVSVKVSGEQFYLNPKYTDNDFNLLNRRDNTTGWENMSYDLSFFCGYERVDIIFYFKANDFDNNYEGVMIDNIRIDGIVDDIQVGNSLGIEVEDEYYYYISYIDNDAWSNEIFGRGIFWGDAYIKIEIFAIYDMGSYWDVVARFWEPWDDFDDLANTDEVHYKIYKNPLNMKDGADLFIPSNNLGGYLDKADNYDRFDWFGGYDIHHWYDNFRNEHNIEFCYDDFRVHLTYSTNGILNGMQIYKNSADMRKIFEMWRSEKPSSDEGDEEGEEERDAIPGYDIPIFIAIISIMSIISAIRIKKLTKNKK